MGLFPLVQHLFALEMFNIKPSHPNWRFIASCIHKVNP